VKTLQAFGLAVLLISLPASQARCGLITGFEAGEGHTAGLAPSAPITSVTGNVTVRTGASFTGPGGGFSAPEGSQFAYLSNGPAANGGGSSGTNRTGALGPEIDVAKMSFLFFAATPGILSFDYDVFTSEVSDAESTNPDPVPDPFEVLVGLTHVVRGAISTANGVFPGVGGFDLVNITGPDGSVFTDGRLGFSTVNVPIGAGNHLLEFFVGDDDDDTIDTALLIDNIRFSVNVVPEPSSLALFVIGSLATFGFGWRKKRTSAVR